MLTVYYGIDRRVVLPHGPQAVLPLLLKLLVEDTTGETQQVASAHASGIQDAREMALVLN